MSAIREIEPLLCHPRTVADLCQLTGYAAGTVGTAVATLKRLGRLDIQKVKRGLGTGSGGPKSVYSLKPEESFKAK